MGDILERESERGQEEEGGRGEKGYERKGGTTTHIHIKCLPFLKIESN